MEKKTNQQNRIDVKGRFSANPKTKEEFDTKPNSKGNFDYIGEISQKIGTGDNAKDAIAYLCLRWSFILLSVIVIILSIYSVVMIYINKEESFVDNLLKGCGIITPIITLLLGYIFANKIKR
ncbi:hypothetical protein [Bacteroides clarus]|uniref:hypothetical protein n=1 Tax=Bacteroides clarus TaxID=626929 RepID=UPI001899F658|nr:hypothetical protein [Bacteroides clarus]